MHKLNEIAKEEIKDIQKVDKKIYIAPPPVDHKSFKLVTSIFFGLGILNLLAYFLPFVDFRGSMSYSDSGYQVISWFNASFEEGPTIAFCVTCIFLLTIASLSFIVYSRIKKNKVSEAMVYTYLKRFNYVYLVVVLTMMIIIFVTIDSMNFRLFGAYELPYAGVGLQMLLWVNMIVPIVLAFIFKVTDAKHQHNLIP